MRPAFDALFAIDDAMGDVVAKASDPALAAIKLAWWREQLEELDRGKVPAEPRLKAAAEHLLPCGVNGAQLAQIEEGWAVLLQDEPDMGLAEARRGRLFGIGAVLIGLDHKLLEGAGRLFAGIDFARRGYRKIEPSKIAMGGIQFPGPLRPLTALTALAFRDLKHGGPPFEAEATPARALALLRHRMFGRIG